MQHASEKTVLGDFSDARFEYFGSETRFLRHGDEYLVRTQDEGGEIREFPVAFTFGVYPLQQYLVEFTGGRLQALPYAWDTRSEQAGGQRWFHLLPDEHVAPGDPLHWTGPNFNWNHMCAECHSTNVQLGYDAASNTFDTSYAEISVGCEACHGPASTHVRQAERESFDAESGLVLNLDDGGQAFWIMNSTTGIAARSTEPTHPLKQPEACGRCHARRSVIAPLYEYGKPLAETHLPIALDESLYFPDGQIQDEVYEYGSFLQSRMYQAGVTCSDCHDPHSLELVTGPETNSVCAQCHLPAKYSVVEHSGHKADKADCVDCHMPTRTYMVVDDRRDHSFQTPRPDLTVAIGTPNACNGCHDNRDADWAAAAIRIWRKKYDPRPHFAPAIAAGRIYHSNVELLGVIRTDKYPSIARATALTLLRHPFSDDDVVTVQKSLRHIDPLIRIAALRALQQLPAHVRMQAGASLLGDPIRAVRLQAVRVFVDLEKNLAAPDRRAFARAAEEYRETSEYLASMPEARMNLGNFYLAGGDTAAAISAYRLALQLDPTFVPIYVNLADALRRSGNDVAAKRVLRDGLNHDSVNASLRHALGLVLVRLDQPEEALAELRHATEADPGNARYAYVHGVALNSLGRLDEATAQLQRARKTFPNDYDIGWALATILRDRGLLSAAEKVAEEMRERFPEDQGVRALLNSLAAQDD